MKPSPYATPGAIGLSNCPLPTKDQSTSTSVENVKDIWKAEDVSQGMEHDYDDSREEPE